MRARRLGLALVIVVLLSACTAGARSPTASSEPEVRVVPLASNERLTAEERTEVTLSRPERVQAFVRTAASQIASADALARTSRQPMPERVRSRLAGILVARAESLIASDPEARPLLAAALHGPACAEGDVEPGRTLRLVYRGLATDGVDPCATPLEN
jgi:hypothetical protein